MNPQEVRCFTAVDCKAMKIRKYCARPVKAKPVKMVLNLLYVMVPLHILNTGVPLLEKNGYHKTLQHYQHQ